MRIGLIGYGGWGSCHARALRRIEDATLAAILCHGDASAAAAARDHPGIPIHRSLDRMLAEGLDAVDIVAPNHLHAPLACAALERGLHVLVEKPLAITEADCRAIAAAAKRAGRLVSVNHELRASEQWARVQQEIASGAIGTPVFGNCMLFRRPFRPGADGWRLDAARVGSWLLEEPVHFFDLMGWYFAAHGIPRDIGADMNGGTGGLSQNMVATVRYGGGAMFTLGQSLGGFGHHLALEIAGTDGALRCLWSGQDARTPTASAGLAIRRRGDATEETLTFSHSGEIFELEMQLRHAIAGLHANRASVPAEEAACAVLLCLAAERAATRGGRVPVDPEGFCRFPLVERSS